MKNRFFALLLTVSMLLAFLPAPAFAQNSRNWVFNDIQNSWASETIIKWTENGLLAGGGDGRFRPGDGITRAEFCAILNKIFKYTVTGQNEFSDIKSGAWYYEAVLKASHAGIISSGSSRFMPEGKVTRQDAAAIISKAFELEPSGDTKARSYADFDKASGDARAALATLVAKGYMAGFSDNSLKPLKNITRAEAVKLLDNVIGNMVNVEGEVSLNEVSGNLVINSGGVRLKNTTVNGDLYLSEGIAEGEVALDNVTVKGNVIIKGGGSIILRDSKLTRVTVKKAESPVKVDLEGKTSVSVMNVVLEGKVGVSADSGVDRLTVQKEAAGTTLAVKGTIKSLEVMAENVILNDMPVKAGTSQAVNAGKATGGTAAHQSSGTGNTGTGSSGNQGSNNPGTTEPVNQWKLVLLDDFAGSSLDTKIWTAVNTDEVYNNELECYRASNAYTEDGNLVLEAAKRKNEAGTKDYTSAKLITKGKKSWTNGKFEIRAKLPGGQGIWPAIWMLPEDDNILGGWPSGGEIDIMEFLGHETNKVYGTLHYGNPHSSTQGSYKLPGTDKFTDGYHVYGMEWEPGEIRWYVDGQLYFTENSWYSGNTSEADYYTYPAPFNRDFYLILNLAVGGDWPGNPDETTSFPAKMYVDYVKVYQKDSYKAAGERPSGDIDPGKGREPLADGNYIYNGSFDQQVEGVPGVNNGTGSTDVEKTSYWTFSHVSANNGTASASNDNGALKVEIADPGNVTYGVQFYQRPLGIEKGETYKVTFDAWASEDRSIMSKVGSEADKSFVNYSGDNTFSLTSAKQSFSYQFRMTGESNASSRLEFNLGNQGVNTVWLDNVRLEKLPKDPNTPRDPLPGGNLIYNGKFDQGSKSMGYWQFSTKNGAVATGTVDPDIYKKEFKAQISNGGAEADSVVLSQAHLNMEKGKSYRIAFNARAERNRSIKVDIAGTNAAGASYSQVKAFDLTMAMKACTYVFEMTADTDTKAQLRFMLGGETGTVYIDNVSVVSFVPSASVRVEAEEAAAGGEVVNNGDGTVTFLSGAGSISQSITVPKAGKYVLSFRTAAVKDSATLSFGSSANKETIPNTNGDWKIVTNSVNLKAGPQVVTVYGKDVSLDWFEIGEDIVRDGTLTSASENWAFWANSPAAGSKSHENGRAKISIENTGANPWDAGLQQKDLSLEMSKLYRLSFDASSSVSRNILVSVDNFDDTVTYAKYMTKNVTLTPEMRNYIMEFSMDAESDENAALTVSLGNVDSSLVSDLCFDNIRLVEITEIESHEIQSIPAPVITEDEAAYGFEDGTAMGFTVSRIVNDADAPTNTAIMNDSTRAFAGGSSLKVIVPNNEEQIQVAVDNPEGLKAGQVITFNVYCTTGSAISGVMPFMLYDESWKWAGGSSVPASELADRWKAISITVPMDHNGITKRLGLRIFTDSSKAPGPIWIDSINIGVSAPVPSSILINEDFNAGIGDWILSSNGGQGTATVTGGALEVDITKVGADNYMPQLSRNNLALENGATYTLTFNASSNTDRCIEVSLLDPGNGYHYFGGSVLALESADDRYSVTFIADMDTNTAALQFNFGTISNSPEISKPATVFIDNIVLKKV